MRRYASMKVQSVLRPPTSPPRPSPAAALGRTAGSADLLRRRAGRLGHRVTPQSLTPAPAAWLQRDALDTPKRAGKELWKWSRDHRPRDGETVGDYVGRFETWLRENDYTITSEASNHLRDNLKIAESGTIGTSLSTWSLSNPPKDGDSAQGHVEAFEKSLAKRWYLLTEEADQRLTNLQLALLESSGVDAAFQTWVLAGGAHDGDTVNAFRGRFRSVQVGSHNRLLSSEAWEQLKGRGLSLIKVDRAKVSFGGWLRKNPSGDDDSRKAHLDRYVTARLAAQRVVTAEARAYLDRNFWTIPSSNVADSLRNFVDDHPPRDGEDADALRQRYLQDLASQDELVLALSRQAAETLDELEIQVFESGELKDLWTQWRTQKPQLEDEEFPAYVKRLKMAMRKKLAWMTVDAVDRLVTEKLGHETVEAMAKANVRSGEKRKDPFQYSGVKMYNPKTKKWERHPEGFLNPDYWEPINAGVNVPPPKWNFGLKQGKKPSAAVNAAFAGPTRLECLSTIEAVLARALLQTMGAAGFDKEFAWKSKTDPGVVIGTNAYRQLGVTNRVWEFVEAPTVTGEEDLVKGDWIYYKNDPRYLKKHPTGLWQGENLIYEGKGLYSGFGLSKMSLDGLKLSMEKAYKADPTAKDTQDSRYDSNLAHSKDPNVVGLLFDSVQRFRFSKVRQQMGL